MSTLLQRTAMHSATMGATGVWGPKAFGFRPPPSTRPETLQWVLQSNLQRVVHLTPHDRMVPMGIESPKTNTQSKVGERMEWLTGKRVIVRVAYAEIGQVGGETFHGVYEDTVPLGREYFFIFNIAGRRKLIRTSSVIEITESLPGEE